MPPDPVNVHSVLILKGDQLYAATLRQYVLQVFPEADVRVVTTLDSARRSLAAAPTDLLLMGAGTTFGGDVLDLLTETSGPSLRPKRVFVVTARCEYRVLAALRALAVDGVFDSASGTPDEFMTALRVVTMGGRYWSAMFSQHLQRPGTTTTTLFRVLTISEQLVLSMIGDGCDDNVASRELGLSPATVATIRRDLHRKLRVQHRGELVRLAAQHGFVRFTPTGIVRPGYALLSAAYHARKPRRSPSPEGGPDRRNQNVPGTSESSVRALLAAAG